VEPVGHATRWAYEGGCKEGGIRLGKSLSNLVKILQDLTSRLRLMGCSLQVVGRLLWDVGRLPRNVGRALLEVGRQATDFSESSLISFFNQSNGKGRRESASARNKQGLPGFAYFYIGKE
jgi:hypothetical protein